MEPVLIASMLDTDMYKMTMMQAMFHRYTGAHTKWRFKARRGNGFPEAGASNVEYLEALNKSLDHMCTLRFQEDELLYLASIKSKIGNRIFKDDFIDYLRLFQYNRNHINVTVMPDGSLDIVLEGAWMAVTGMEVPVLGIVSELHSQCELQAVRLPHGKALLKDKIAFLQEKEKGGVGTPRVKFADFGTRRRYSFAWQDFVLSELIRELPNNLVGTSNMYFAMKYDLTPIGTMAHEWFQGHQQLGGRLVDSQKAALEAWAQEYRGELGIALSDICGFDAFLRDFDLYFAKLFDGCRHDSGDPVEWCEKLIYHYRQLGIDPKTKTAVFSDGLTFERAWQLNYMFNAFINCSFGIGTNLMNDMGTEPISIVLKMIELNGKPVAKVSDSQGKGMCEDPEFEAYIRKVFDIENPAVYDSEPPEVEWICHGCLMSAGTNVNVGQPDNRECDVCHRNDKCYEVIKK
jgi:nicotinate phosphoribosyltransferase